MSSYKLVEFNKHNCNFISMKSLSDQNHSISFLKIEDEMRCSYYIDANLKYFKVGDKTYKYDELLHPCFMSKNLLYLNYIIDKNHERIFKINNSEYIDPNLDLSKIDLNLIKFSIENWNFISNKVLKYNFKINNFDSEKDGNKSVLIYDFARKINRVDKLLKNKIHRARLLTID